MSRSWDPVKPLPEHKEAQTKGKWVIGVVIALSVILSLVGGCDRLYKRYGIEPENAVEELSEAVAEQAIEHYTGLELTLDFSPESPEE